MDQVYVVHHEYEWRDGSTEWKCVGAFATEGEAEAAIAHLRTQPGFCWWPDGFSVTSCKTSERAWAEGFAIMLGILLPLPGREGRYIGAMASWHPGERYEVCSIDDDAPPDLAFRVGDFVSCRHELVDDCEELVAVSVVDGPRPAPEGDQEPDAGTDDDA